MSQLPFPQGEDGKPFDLGQLGEMLQQVGAMMKRAEQSGESGPVSWSTIREVARGAIAKAGDPSVTDAQRKSVVDAVELAQTWLNSATEFPAASTKAAAWSRSEWLESTLDQWKPLVDPIAAGLAQTVATMSAEALPEGEVPPELQQLLAPMIEMAKKMSAVSTGMQMGNGFAALSTEMLGAGDVGLPLSADFTPALLPNHVTAFAAENELPASELMVFLAVRESALQRLYAGLPWLRNQIAGEVARFAHGIEIDHDRIRETMSGINPEDPESMQQVMASGAFAPVTSEAQQRNLDAIELLLATIEGWVAAVTAEAVDERLPSVAAMTETMNRRRVSGGPAEQTFGNLVGLELRPRLVRKALAFWTALGQRVGTAARDGYWQHPDLLPTADELEDVEGFIAARA